MLSRGLLGWEPRVPERRVRLAPQLPAEWPRLTVHQLPLGAARYDLTLAREPGRFRARLQRTSGTAAVDTLIFEPRLPPGTTLRGVDGDLRGRCEAPAATPTELRVSCRLPLGDTTDLVLDLDPGYQVLLPPASSLPGDRSHGVRLVDLSVVADTAILTFEGPAGTSPVIRVRRRQEQDLGVSFPLPGDPLDGYSRIEQRLWLPAAVAPERP